MNPLWKSYKSKVMKTFNPEAEDEPVEEVCEEVEPTATTVQQDEGPSAVSQLAKRMQGAGAKGWRSVTALFNKDDEHQLLEPEMESHQPVADHPLAIKPEETTRPNKRLTGFWDNFSTKWHQAAAMKQAEAGAPAMTDASDEGRTEGGTEERSQEEGNQVGAENEAGGEAVGHSNSFSKYASLGATSEDTSFKWNFVTGKLAELKNKSMTKSN